AKGLDLGDDVLPIGVTEGGVVDHNVGFGNPLVLQVGFENLVGGAGVDIVGARQYPALHTHLVHQVIHRGNGLLVGGGAGIEDILGGLFTLVLHRVEHQAVEFFDHRQHGLAGHRGPAAEDHI